MLGSIWRHNPANTSKYTQVSLWLAIVVAVIVVAVVWFHMHPFPAQVPPLPPQSAADLLPSTKYEHVAGFRRFPCATLQWHVCRTANYPSKVNLARSVLSQLSEFTPRSGSWAYTLAET